MESTNSGGISLTGILTIVFMVLKLTGHIDWSWIWVFSPLWLPVAMVFAVWIVAYTIAVIVTTKKEIKNMDK